VSGARISSISPDSPAQRAGLSVGDEIISINGRQPTDIIEYQQMIDDADPVIVIQRAGEDLQRKILITKSDGEKVGLTIDSAVFDRIRTCDNHCTFCFIYQLPKGLRKSLYVKDDDFRLSFLYGNYTTLTRFTEFDLERVVEEKLSPLYVSIHTTDPDLRASMLRNPRGATSLRWLRELLDAKITVHGQVVLCPGVNDGPSLIRTLDDVLTDYSDLASVSLVPLGVSDFTTEATMRAHTREEALEVIRTVARYREMSQEIHHRDFIFASDEFFLIAGLAPPGVADLPSLDEAENGVGLVAAFAESFRHRQHMEKLGSGFFQSVDGAPPWGYRAVRSDRTDNSRSTGPVSLLTGEYAAPLLRELLVSEGYLDVEVIAVENRYFGGNIKVAGLLTASDISRVMGELGPNRQYAIADVCLSENRFLDGLGLEDLPMHVSVVETTGSGLRSFLDSSARNVHASESVST